MQSLRTIYRVVVMAATIVIVVQAWKLYGPSAEQVKSLALRGVEMAQGVLQPSREPAAAVASPSPASGGDSSTAAPLFQSSGGPAPPAAPELVAVPVARTGAEHSSDQSQGDPITPVPASQRPASDDDRMQALFARLEQLGARDPQLSQWGSSGELCRFSCQATWGESTQFTRHFESVAAEPVLAIQQVLAEVDAWRMAQHNGAVPR